VLGHGLACCSLLVLGSPQSFRAAAKRVIVSKLGVARVTFPDTEKTSAIMYLFSMPWPKKSPGKRNAAGATHVAWSVGGLGRGDQRDVIAQN